MWQRLSQSQRFFIIVALAILYVHTWIGGRRAHEQEMATRVASYYSAAVERNAELSSLGLPPLYRLRAGGPKSTVDWCVPILPGVLLTESSYTVGPLYAQGGQKVVIYYGVGSFTLLHLWGWRS